MFKKYPEERNLGLIIKVNKYIDRFTLRKDQVGDLTSFEVKIKCTVEFMLKDSGRCIVRTWVTKR